MGGDAGGAERGGDAGRVEGEGLVHLPELHLQRLHRAGHLRVERARARPHRPPAAPRVARPRREGGGGQGGGGCGRRHRRRPATDSNPHTPTASDVKLKVYPRRPLRRCSTQARPNALHPGPAEQTSTWADPVLAFGVMLQATEMYAKPATSSVSTRAGSKRELSLNHNHWIRSTSLMELSEACSRARNHQYHACTQRNLAAFLIQLPCIYHHPVL